MNVLCRSLAKPFAKALPTYNITRAHPRVGQVAYGEREIGTELVCFVLNETHGLEDSPHQKTFQMINDE